MKITQKYFFFRIIFQSFALKKQGVWGRIPRFTYKKPHLFGASMYGRNSRVTHPTVDSLPTELATGDVVIYGGQKGDGKGEMQM